MNKAIRILRDEHRSISAVLQGLQALARKAQDPSLQPEFLVFHAMIHYIDAFPERLHHPKEDRYLFARLGERAPEARALIKELLAEHVEGARLVRDLEQALFAFETQGRSRAAGFAAAVDAYARFHWEHMRKEEHELLPLAERKLTGEDWREIGEAFSGNDDPIADLREHDLAALFSRIVSLAPDPVGIGERWKNAG